MSLANMNVPAEEGSLRTASEGDMLLYIENSKESTPKKPPKNLLELISKLSVVKLYKINV